MPMPTNALRAPHLAAVLGAAWLAIVLQLLWADWAGTATTLGDTDDAMRLVQVRAFLAGQGWFDLREMRLEPPGGYESHWSRLIDAGLAGVFLFFRLFADPELAERLMRTAWPVLWLLPTLVGVAAIAYRLGGRDAALICLLLAAAGLPAAQQFKPGRIDHHNVQIATAVLVVAATVWSDRNRFAAVFAGVASGFALAIGLESLPILLACGAGLALRFALRGEETARALRGYGLALAAATALAFFSTVGPDHWSRAVCDTLALNSGLAVGLGGLALAAATLVPGRRGAPQRISAVAAAGALTVAVFLVSEPRCLQGPFALIDPAVRPLWLDHVREALPWRTALRTMPQTALALAAFPFVASLAAAAVARRAFGAGDAAASLAVAAFAVALLTTLGAIKAYPYAAWLGMPLVATALPPLFAAMRVEAFPARAAAALFLAPSVVSLSAVMAAEAAGFGETPEAAEAARCFDTSSYAALAGLRPGLVAAAPDDGPFLLALTPHSVLAAPYHRLSRGIVAAHDSFAKPPEAARDVVSGAGIDYLVTCGTGKPVGLRASERDASLWGRLAVGEVPGWLERVPLPPDQPFVAYRVKPLNTGPAPQRP